MNDPMDDIREEREALALHDSGECDDGCPYCFDEADWDDNWMDDEKESTDG